MIKNDQLTYKELASRWGVCDKTARRDVRRFELPVADFIGHQPVFSLPEVEKMELRRRSRLAANQKLKLNGSKIITVKSAKKLAHR